MEQDHTYAFRQDFLSRTITTDHNYSKLSKGYDKFLNQHTVNKNIRENIVPPIHPQPYSTLCIQQPLLSASIITSIKKEHSYSLRIKETDVTNDDNVPTFQLHPDRLNDASTIKQKIATVLPSSACCICAKVLYPANEHWIQDIPHDKQRARLCMPQNSYVQIAEKSQQKAHKQVIMTSACLTCSGNYKKAKSPHIFDDFGPIPECIATLTSYTEYRKLSIASIYCNTFRPLGYSYLHSKGDITMQPNKDLFKGLVGFMKPDETGELPTTIKNVAKAMTWLRKHNFLYKDYIPQGETVRSHLIPMSSSCAYPALPVWTPDMEIVHGGQLPASAVSKMEGLVFPSSAFNQPKVPTALEEITIGENILKNQPDIPKVQPIRFDDEHLEAKIFTHLFPFGSGSWAASKQNGISLGAYHKIRLNHADSRWRKDRYYPFWAFDRSAKARITYVNKVLATNKNREKPITAGNIKDDQGSYYKYGNVLPANIIGSKPYMKKKWLQLVAIVSHRGAADIFLTITANDSWPELIKILSQYENSSPVMNAQDVSEYFFKRFDACYDVIHGKKSVFGDVEYWWYRVESQNRGALHIHEMLWLKPGTMKNDAIVAELPRGNDEASKALREKVLKFQMHHCRPMKCYRNNKGQVIAECKNGFPAPLRTEEGYSDDGTRFEYIRRHPEDQRVVPYNPYLLDVWNAHICVLKVTENGLERYLVKYAAKEEPTFGLAIVEDNQVKKYIESRVIGSPEACGILNSHPIVKSNMSVIYIDTNLPNDRVRVMKPSSDVHNQEDDAEELFEPSAREHYMFRPVIPPFDDMSLPVYLTEYSHAAPNKIPKYAENNCLPTQDNMFVYKKNKALIPRTHFLTALDGERFYYQQLLWNIPFRDDTKLISPENVSKTYKEQCFIQGIFDEHDDLDVSFAEMKRRKFDPAQIAQTARKMLIAEMAPLSEIQNKVNNLDYGDIIIDSEDFQEYDTIPVADISHEHADNQVRKLLHYNRDMIMAETIDVSERMKSFTPEQKHFFTFVESNMDKQKLTFCTGPGGTGKSYLLHTVKQFLELSGETVAVTGTSGTAAKLIGGQTLHSFLAVDGELKCSMTYKDQNWRRIAAVNTLIIDETSLMSAELLEKAEEICSECCEKPSNKLFGGKNVFLFGDPYQIPSVETTTTPRQVYSSKLWPFFTPFFMKTNCRQKDPTFREMLDRFRVGEQTEEDIAVLKTRECGKGHKIEEECLDFTSPGVMAMCSKHDQRNAANIDIQEKTLKQKPLHTLKARDYDDAGNRISWDESDQIDQIQGVMPSLINVRIGAKVCITRNLDVQHGVVNGSRGYLRSVHPKVLIVEDEETQQLIPVTRVKQKVTLQANNKDYMRIQYPIILSWVSTIHRGQGFTVSILHAYLDENIFACGQAYTALSRVKELKHLHIKKLDVKAFKVDPLVRQMMKDALTTNQMSSICKKQKTNHDTQSLNDCPAASTVLHQADSTTIQNNERLQLAAPARELEITLPTGNISKEAITEILAQMTTIATDHLKWQLFEPPLNISNIEKLCNQYKPTIEKMSIFQNKPPAVFNPVFDQPAQNITIPDAMKCDYVAVDTPPDGNCTFHAVSISLYGDITLTKHLKILSVYVLITQKKIVMDIIRMDKPHKRRKITMKSFYEDLLQTARLWKKWGNEYHLLTLAIALQRDIYCYSIFNQNIQDPQELQRLFQTRKHSLGNHLLYRAPLQLQKADYNNSGPLCIFYNGINHYTSIKPTSEFVHKYTPHTELLSLQH